MAEFAGVEIKEWEGYPSGYTDQEKAWFEGFAAALTDPAGRLRDMISDDFTRTDGNLYRPDLRATRVGAEDFTEFRLEVDRGSKPHRTTPMTGFWVPRGLIDSAFPETKPQLPAGARIVTAAIRVPYTITGNLFVPPLPGGEPEVITDAVDKHYTLDVVESVVFDPNRSPRDVAEDVRRGVGGLAVRRWGLFPHLPEGGYAAPQAIKAELDARRNGQQWPPRSLEEAVLAAAA